MDGRLLSQARARLAKKKENNRMLQEQREAEVYSAIPELRRIDAQQRALVGEVLKLTTEQHMDTATALAKVEEKSLLLCAEKAELLTEYGFAADYLDEIICCHKCHDSGYLRNGDICECLKTMYEEERSKELSFLLHSGEESFSDFRLDYYTGSARECMEATYEVTRQYALHFDKNSPNLLFQGSTGLGKTFLSGCVAKAVASRGFSVVYQTAQEAFGAFEEQKFSKDAETYTAASDKVKRILQCDLLILDDLGTELTTNFTQSALYNIINTRLTEQKKTIISTNLSDSELAARYIPQIVSRIGGEYDTVLFMGRDIRALRKEQRYQ